MTRKKTSPEGRKKASPKKRASSHNEAHDNRDAGEMQEHALSPRESNDEEQDERRLQSREDSRRRRDDQDLDHPSVHH